MEFLITFKNNIPHYSLCCPVCSNSEIKVLWIDRAKYNKEMNKK